MKSASNDESDASASDDQEIALRNCLFPLTSPKEKSSKPTVAQTDDLLKDFSHC